LKLNFRLRQSGEQNKKQMTDNRQTTGGEEKDKARCGFIYRVTFREPPEQTGERDFFFTSLSAIYERFSPEQIGCKVSRLWNIGVSDGNPYTGAKTTVTREPLHTKRQNKARTACFTPSDEELHQ
jgi:hypothetical protein